MKQFAEKYEDIISVENLLLAWKEFVKGKRGKRDVQEFSLHLMDNVRKTTPWYARGNHLVVYGYDEVGEYAQTSENN